MESKSMHSIPIDRSNSKTPPRTREGQEAGAAAGAAARAAGGDEGRSLSKKGRGEVSQVLSVD